VLVYFAVTLTIVGVVRSLLHAKRRAAMSAAEVKRHQHEREQEIVQRRRVEMELDAVKKALRSYGSMLEKQVVQRAEKLADRLNLDPLQN
jgi:ribosomal protein L9